MPEILFLEIRIIISHIGNGVPDNSAVNDTAQGNFIGTDVTGTVSLPAVASGIGIVNEATNITIGGTTPSARNIISGKQFPRRRGCG